MNLVCYFTFCHLVKLYLSFTECVRSNERIISSQPWLIPSARLPEESNLLVAHPTFEGTLSRKCKAENSASFLQSVTSPWSLCTGVMFR
jgi:hypothetical protein